VQIVLFEFSRVIQILSRNPYEFLDQSQFYIQVSRDSNGNKSGSWAQWRDMTLTTSNISQAYDPINGQVSPQKMVCNCSFREDVEDFALNALLSHPNDPTLW
jgi:hypothetical protein